MKHKTQTKVFSWMLSLTLVFSLLPGLSMTALAEAPERIASVTVGDVATNYTEFSAAVTAWNNVQDNVATLTLLTDVSTDSTISVGTGSKVLDLNGYGITKTGDSGSVISVSSGATLTLEDSKPSQDTGENRPTGVTGGYITGGKGLQYQVDNHQATRGGGVLVQGTFTMKGGTIAGNNLNFSSGSNGGGVAVDQGGTFNMEGGTITGNCVKLHDNAGQANTAGVGHGSGVFVQSGATFKMSGGAIFGNTGVHGAVSLLGSAKGTISGGTIQANKENQAIHTNGANGSFKLAINGGTINGNDKPAFSLQGSSDDQLTLSDAPTISGNMNLDGADIKVVGYTGAPIPVYRETTGVFTSSRFSDAAAAQAVFTSANPYFEVTLDENGQAQLSVIPIPYKVWDEESKSVIDAAEPCRDYTIVTDDTKTMGTSGKETWYVVKNNVTINDQIALTGNVHLILCDGAKLTADAQLSGQSKAVIDGGNNDITIYAQSTDESTMGGLEVTASAEEKGADAIFADNLTINGGRITAKGKDDSTTKKSSLCATHTISINGGIITASGSAYGIYSGQSTVTVNGGTVTANGTENGIFANNGGVTINDGNVTVTGDKNAIQGTVKNAIAGIGWTDLAGAEAAIKTSNDGRELEYKKVQFPQPMATVITPPKANDLTYNGQAQELVTAGIAEDGTLKYALGKDAQTAPKSDEWGELIPTATDAGTYYVWYKVVGDNTHSDSEAACVQAEIDRAPRATKYKVNLPGSTEHGTVTAKPTSAAKGRTVTITAAPDEGCEVDEIRVTDKKGDPVETTKNEDGTYTFKMPASQVTVSAAFKESEEPTPVKPDYDKSQGSCGRDADCPMKDFTDLDRTAWYHDGVHFCLANIIMNGNGDGTFDPEGMMTRAEIVQILYNTEGRPAIRSGIPFSDVTEEDWFAMAVSWAESNGIINGNGDGTFLPNAPVTREQIAKILFGYAEMKGLDVSQSAELNFADAESISDWAVPYLRWAVGAELIRGRDEGPNGILLAPQEGAKRAEAATLMMRFCLDHLSE